MAIQPICRTEKGQGDRRMEKLIDENEIKKFAALLPEVKRIVVTCHIRPDGDAIGSCLGTMHLLRALGKEVTVVIPDQAPRSLSFLPGFRDIAINTQHEEYVKEVIAEADLLICNDFNKPSRQGRLEEVVKTATCKKVMIDHHQDPDNFCDITFSYPSMSSACEVAFRVYAALGLYLDMNTDCATCLLTGMVTDTRNFSVNVVNPDIYEILEKLLEKGANKTRIVKEALETRSYWSLKLEAYALSEKLEILPRHHAAITTLSSQELERYHYQKGDTEGLVNKALEVRGVICSFFLRQDDDCVKVSARAIRNFPVSKICEDLFGGGGHLMAAGAEFNGTLEECKRILTENLPSYDRYLPRHMDEIEINTFQD